MVVKFLDDNKLKKSLKKCIHAVSKFIALIQFHLFCQLLAKFSEVESERTVSKFRIRKRKFRVVFMYSIKRALEIRSFMSQSCNDG